MNFKKIYLIGEGRIAKECLKIAHNFFKQEVLLITLKNKNELDVFFEKISNSLILSVNNFYIFQKKCVESNFIINYHNSLLPKYKGRNAHIWAIWNQENITGITWHKVDCTIDTGDIILQKEIKINNSLTAIKLLQMQQNLAIKSFEECLKNIKNSFPQPKIISVVRGGDIHKISQLPNNGILDISWNILTMERFLRAMDNGNLTPKAKVKINNMIYDISFYEINHLEIILFLSNNIKITIPKE
ncbi:formyl transferase [Campylobacter sp. IFREMER_LSEM_CL2090]|uniref:formyltransferase family protein n=1 Tax=Campylobacter sp. IFREMER_LSEM_CL2090 TaxID=2911617 RepID=UPI0021E7E07C|nr:formyltransferase family protein [Campylobacter sp. IFREMER_LSEM_CL2090]MCV3402584.1 formyl transferase [Campylobacter sp. IFREMER_LSEM_CL2090]